MSLLNKFKKNYIHFNTDQCPEDNQVECLMKSKFMLIGSINSKSFIVYSKNMRLEKNG